MRCLPFHLVFAICNSRLSFPLILLLVLVEFFPGYSVAATQAIEVERAARRQAGRVIAPNAPRTPAEELLAIRLRLLPVRHLLCRLQHAGAQVLDALWPGVPTLRTPSRTAAWLEAAGQRFEAWKGSAARAGAQTALEFAKSWYPGLSLEQLETFRAEA